MIGCFEGPEFKWEVMLVDMYDVDGSQADLKESQTRRERHQ